MSVLRKRNNKKIDTDVSETVSETETETESKVNNPQYKEVHQNDDVPTAPKKLLKTQMESKSRGKFFNMYIRTFTSIAMSIIGFFILALGHFQVSLFVYSCIFLIFLEVINIKRKQQKDKKLPLTRILPIQGFFVQSSQAITSILQERLALLRLKYNAIDFYMKNMEVIQQILGTIGLITFVLSLRKGFMRQQFTMLGWCCCLQNLVLLQSLTLTSNVYVGLIWFFLPVSSIVINDTMAQFCGFFLGKTPLIKLSPKKTWEGFIGGYIFTMLWSIFLSKILQKYDYWTCQIDYITLTPFPFDLTCNKDYIFIEQIYFKNKFQELSLSPFNFHSLAIGTFVSWIAPFGGFFASGVKRAFRIKDFGESIPGHGGTTDRLDCQILCGIKNFIKSSFTIQDILNEIAGLKNVEQIQLFNQLKQALIDKGILS